MKKSFARKLGVITLVTLSAGLLTACDPPPPPELLAQLAEQNPTCIEGDVQASGTPSFDAVLTAWADGAVNTCVDPLPAMSLSIAADVSTAQLVYSADPLTSGSAFASVPVAMDAAVLSYNVPNMDSILVSYKTLAGILGGKVTNWNDAAIAKDNPGMELPDLPLLVQSTAEANSLKAIENLLGNQGLKVDSAKFTAVSMADFQSPELAPGEVVIQPNSLAILQGSTTLGFLTGGKDPETGELNQAYANEESLSSAATQLVATKNGNVLDVVLDPKLEPKPLFEGEKAATPYQAVFPIRMYLVGEDSQLTRAMAMFTLRMDSQGSLGYANLGALPEIIRVEAIGIVSKGLPTPEVTQKPE